MATEREVIEVLEHVLLTEAGALTVQTRLHDVSGWESSAMVYFLGEVLGRWGAELSAEHLRTAETVGDLVRCVREQTP